MPDEHYPAVPDWINGHHLNARLVYYRVPAAVGASRRLGFLRPVQAMNRAIATYWQVAAAHTKA